MAKAMLKQGINPGYAHPRVSMADLLSMAPGLKDAMVGPVIVKGVTRSHS